MKSFKRLLAAGTVFMAPCVLMAQLSGSNAVAVLEDNVSNATGVSWPLVVGIITALVALAVFMKIGRRAGIKA